ncbi:heme ABC transporter ATP-binding protein [Amylibacter marinus]|uniref:Heme ABC transporter ATP-binding protein n=1 Tax=Amylibacter marinus TaxID=1475483 RepID=A0ABQ5VVN0_9RHOB|nr:ABC transporter ATP-binding protein [Amylibacter marinus]GLQ35491.1 heme ABC transporter ATP-binding protein [Amylibacter marinus]
MSDIELKTSGDTPARFALELQGISKSFGTVRANRDIDLQVPSGTIHGIIGENGAGKSTLMNILYGLHRADAGEMRIDGTPCKIRSSADSIALGIGMVHQHFMLVPRFSVLENVMLGSEGGGLLRAGRGATLDTLKRLGETYGMVVDPNALISDLNVGTRQRVEILKALKGGARILILDEPTGVLTPQETEQLFEILKVLRDDGVTILLITHKLDEIMAVTDNVSIMRAGTMVGHRETAQTNAAELAELMVGRKVLLTVEKGPANPTEILLSVDNLGAVSSRGHDVLKDMSFDLRGGEILGIAGVSGNGQTQLLEILTGMRVPDRGQVNILGDKISKTSPKNPRELREMGLAHIPEDRHIHGLVLDFEAQENVVLGYHRDDITGTGALIDRDVINTHCAERMETFDVRPSNPALNAKNFSGGNQQKIVIAREIYSNPRVLIVGQPTRGVDVGAIEFIHKQLIALRDAGCAIVVVSVELEEVLGLSDRIMVMNDGQSVGIVDAADTDVNQLGLMMAGISQEAAE